MGCLSLGMSTCSGFPGPDRAAVTGSADVVAAAADVTVLHVLTQLVQQDSTPQQSGGAERSSQGDQDMRTHTHSDARTCVPTHTEAAESQCAHSCRYEQAHSHDALWIHMYTHTHTHTHTHTNLHTYIHTYIHTYTHTQM